MKLSETKLNYSCVEIYVYFITHFQNQRLMQNLTNIYKSLFDFFCFYLAHSCQYDFYFYAIAYIFNTEDVVK